MVSPSSDKVINEEGRRYHINVKPGELARFLLIPGAPERAVRIAEFWDDAREVAYHREFRSFTGRYKGVELSAISSGIGPSSMAIVVNEVANLGVHTLIRVGSTGAIQEDIGCGEVIISTSAVRLDGTSQSYVIPEYPANSSYETLLALVEAAESLGIRYHLGITATTSDFYAGQGRPASRGFHRLETNGLIQNLRRANVLNFEMETATLFVLSNLFNLRAGSVCAVYANRCSNIFKPGAGEEECIRVANEAVVILNVWDKEKQQHGKKWFYPGLLKMR